MTPEEKINYAMSLEADKMLGVRSPRIDALIPAALRLALAARWVDVETEHDGDGPFDCAFCSAHNALNAFLALLPEPPKEGTDGR